MGTRGGIREGPEEFPTSPCTDNTRSQFLKQMPCFTKSTICTILSFPLNSRTDFTDFALWRMHSIRVHIDRERLRLLSQILGRVKSLATKLPGSQRFYQQAARGGKTASPTRQSSCSSSKSMEAPVLGLQSRFVDER